MIKTFKKSAYPYVLLASIPLLILGGCASQDTAITNADAVTPATEVNEPITEVQDPVVLQTAHASEFDSESSNPVTSANEDIQPAVSLASMPQEQLIGFAFDQAEVNEQYQELLKQHAQYLSENTNLTLEISGHTDSYGPKEYNQYLSTKRAEEVAKLLMEYGAPGDRIMVKGNADDEPLVSATTQRELRRVELDYQDQRLVSY